MDCLHTNITETPCCASGRCSKHSDKNYGCGCWLTQAIRASQTRCGRPEASVLNVEAAKCDMATKPLDPHCEDCQSGISCFRHMGICQKTAFTACDLCSKYKCHERRCIAKICCDESYVRMIAEKSCEKEVLTESKLPPLAPLSSSLMSAATTAECLPAAAAAVTTIMLSAKKSDAELLGMLNEERKQVTAHTNLTKNASMNDCVRYFDIGQDREKRDDSSEERALNGDKCKLRRSPQACKQKKVKARKRMSDFTTTSQRTSTTKKTLVSAVQVDRVNLKRNGACLCRLSDGCPGSKHCCFNPQ